MGGIPWRWSKLVGDGTRILVVDDNASLRRSLAALLARAGHEVIQAADGAEACRICREVDVLNEVPGAPAPSITISLDRSVQNAAQDAVNMVGRKAMIVFQSGMTKIDSVSRTVWTRSLTDAAAVGAAEGSTGGES